MGKSIRKWKREIDSAVDECPMKLRAKIPIDYQYLNDPFPDKEENNAKIANIAEIVYNIMTKCHFGGNNPKDLNKACKSPEWPEWKKAINKELEQLDRLHTVPGYWLIAQKKLY